MIEIEVIAFILGLTYLVGISYSKRWAWFFGVLNAAIYFFICLETKLFIQAGLQGIYCLFGFYGYLAWGKTKYSKVNTWKLSKHFTSTIIACIVAILCGFILLEYSSQKDPFLDAFISVFAILATYLTAHHVLENWYYWILINLSSILLFFGQELYITAGMFFINLVVSGWGLYQWKLEENKIL